MEGPPLGPGGEDITWPDQVAPRGRKASSTGKIKPQTSNLGSPRRRARPGQPPVGQPGGRGEGPNPNLRAVLPECAAGGPRGAGGCPTSVPPSAFLGQATKRVSLASLWSWRAWPPYFSGSCSRVVSGRGPCGVLVRWRGFPCLPRHAWEQAVGGVGACGVQAQLCHPPGRRGPLGGRGDAPCALRGVKGRRPRGPRAGWGGVGGEGRGGRAVDPHLPLRGGRPVAPSPAPLLRQRLLPRYTCSAGVVGQPRAPGAAWPAAGGSAWWGGGGLSVRRPPRGGAGGGKVSLPRSVSPPSPGGHQGGSLCLCPALPTALAHVRVPLPRCGSRGPLERRRRAAGLLQALQEWVGGRLEALGVQHSLSRLWRPPLGVVALPGGGSPPWARRGGCGATAPLAGLWLFAGRGGERGGGRAELSVVPPRSPGPAPRRLRGGGLVVLVPGGQLSTGGAHCSPAPLHPPGARPSCGPSPLGPPLSLLLPPHPVVPVGRGGGEGRRVLGVAVWVSG